MAASWIESKSQLENFIGNQWVRPAKGAYLNSMEPATGHILLPIADSDSEDVDQAVQAAQKAFETWKKTNVRVRSDFLLKIAGGG